MIKICIFNETSARVPRKKLTNLFGKIMNEEADSDWCGKVNLVFTSDRHIRKLNRIHRGRNTPTDVLSFNIERPERDDAVFGEIYISIETSHRQARRNCVKPVDELLRLTCHGTLHLLGYDHLKLSDRERMRERERHFLEGVGVKWL